MKIRSYSFSVAEDQIIITLGVFKERYQVSNSLKSVMFSEENVQ